MLAVWIRLSMRQGTFSACWMPYHPFGRAAKGMAIGYAGMCGERTRGSAANVAILFQSMDIISAQTVGFR